MQHAVAIAYKWPIDWPETKLPGYIPPADIDELDALKERVAKLELALEAMAQRAAKTDARTRRPPAPRPRPTDPTPPK